MPSPLCPKETHHVTHSTYLQASGLGALRGVLRTPIEHPFDAVKTYWQSDPSINGFRQVVKRMYTRYGWSGFYAGGLPSTLRYTTKELYRWPLMLHLPSFYDKLLNRIGSPLWASQRTTGISQCLAGVTVANIECLITCPFEVLKVQLVTRRLSTRPTEVISTVINNSLHLHHSSPTDSTASRSLLKPSVHAHRRDEASTGWRGLRAYYLRQNVSWVSFLYFNDFFKLWARRVTDAPTHQPLSPGWLVVVSAQVGVVNTLLVLPLDCIKTQMQLSSAHPTSLGRTAVGSRHPTAADCTTTKSCVVCGHRLLSVFGLRGLFVGFNLRLAQYIVNSVLTVSLLEHIQYRGITA